MNFKYFTTCLIAMAFCICNVQAQFASNAFASKLSFPTMAGPQGLDFCDLNNDGKKDILVGNVNGNTLSVFVNNSNTGNLNSSSFNNSFQLPTLGNNPGLISTPDFDGDGKQDILLGYTLISGNQFSIFLNKYDGIKLDSSSFIRYDFTAGTKPEGMTSGDFDNDGKIDLAVANNVSNNVYVFKNTSTPGNISLGSPLIYATGNAPNASAVGDIDNDGKIDLAVSNWNSNSITIYKNTSLSTSIAFNVVKTINTYTTQTNPYWIKIVDFNNDGIKEVVCSNWGSSSISIYSDSATPGISLGLRTDISLTPAQYTQGTAISDFDNDGKLDIAISMAGNNYISLLKNISTGGPITSSSFSTQMTLSANTSPVGATAIDLDNDYRPDIINTNFSSNNISIFKNRIIANEPTIQASNFSSQLTGTTAIINIKKGNGAKRLIIAKAGSPVNAIPKDTSFYMASSVFGNGADLGSGNFIVYSDTGSSILLTGLNANTIYFFTVIEYNGIGGYSNYLLQNILSGSTIISKPFSGNDFAAKIDLTVGSGPQGMEVSDLNNDGKKEIIVGNVNDNSLSVFINNTTIGSINNSGFTSFQLSTIGNNPALLSAPDFDGDGKKDILLGYAKNSGTQFSVYLNKYNGTSLDSSSFIRTDFTAGTKPEGMMSGDFDNDGKVDLVVANNVSNNIYIFKNTSSIGNVSLATPIIYPVGNAPDATAVGDIDNDGKLDIAVSNWSSNSVTIYRNTSNSSGISFTVVNSINSVLTQTNPYWIKIVDFNNDGLKEIVCSNWGSSSVSIFSNISSTGITFAPRIDINLLPALYTQGTAIEDFDHDGFLDLAVSMAGNDSISVFRNNGLIGALTPFSFSSKTNYQTGVGPVGAISTDLDLDLKPEIIVTNFTAGTISILKNQILAFEPSIQTSALNVTATGSLITLNFTPGNGNKRLVLVKENSIVNDLPKDSSFYSANTVYGTGSQIGSGNYVVYSDSGSSVTITGLSASKHYYFSIVEYNGIGGYSNYLLTYPLRGNNAVGLIEKSTNGFNMACYPNPFTNNTNVSFDLPYSANVKVTASDALGKQIKSSSFGKMHEGKQQIILDETYFGSAGLYLIQIEIDNFMLHKKLIKQ